MPAKTIHRFTALLVFSLVGSLVGCAHAPAYVEPSAQLAQAATFRCDNDLAIQLIDEQNSESLSVQKAGVRVAPGQHRMTIALHPGLNLAPGIQLLGGSTTIRAEIDAKPGATYLFCVENDKITLRNTTAGRSWFYDDHTFSFVAVPAATATQPARK